VQHQLGDVSFPVRGSLVTPCAPITLAGGEPLLGQPVEDCHHSGMRKITISQPQADLADCERLGAVPEDIHDGTFELTKPVHGVTIPFQS
jgi:hypothetical protein